MKQDLAYLKPLVARVLQQPYDSSDWTVQGFGFLRTYFGPVSQPKRFRLNLWDKRFTIPNVSTIHDHPWDFSSIIVAGFFGNVRYDLFTGSDTIIDGYAATHCYSTIMTGVASKLEKSPIKTCVLYARKPELYTPGDTYQQRANEIHETSFVDGSVTLNERVGDTEHARVFWPAGSDWVDAKPRKATRDEVADAVATSLREWF